MTEKIEHLREALVLQKTSYKMVRMEIINGKIVK